MEPTLFHLEVVSADKVFFSAPIKRFLVSGSEGGLEIYKGHTPLLTVVKPGMIRIVKQCGHKEVIYISGGVVEVQPLTSTVLADTAIRGEELDEEKILKAKLCLERSLKKSRKEGESSDYAHVLGELVKLNAQLRVIEQVKTLR